MSTIKEQLDRLTEYKAAIKLAIIDMGVNVGDNLSTYADAIKKITPPYRCKIVIKDRKSISVTEKLIGLDLTKTYDNMGYQYNMSQAQTDNIQINFTVSNIEETTVMTSKGYKFCIKCDGGPYDKYYLCKYGEYKFNLTTTPTYWYSNINPITKNAKMYIYRAYNQTYMWKTDTDAVGNKVYNNGGGASDGNIRVEFRENIE